MIIDSGSKLLIVILVLLVILLGLAAFLFYLERRLAYSERKIRELEKEEETGRPGEMERGRRGLAD
ncbi:MAG: hypothetical protein R6U64_08105 [Bacteroidales bacterium]